MTNIVISKIKKGFGKSLLTGESGTVGWGIAIGIKRFPVQSPLGTQPGLIRDPTSLAPSDLWVEIVQMQWLTSG